VGSAAGKEGNPRASAYSASKAAVIGFTKSLGKELAKDGVTVNAVAPAVIETPMLGKVDQDRPSDTRQPKRGIWPRDREARRAREPGYVNCNKNDTNAHCSKPAMRCRVE
jgi:NAD(P)-dependent dehydrogenase (short-subunit alcohol dehydrogenase family)